MSYTDFISEVSQTEAAIKALNRLAKLGKIAKLSKGKYYKPENTPFGNLQPNQAQIVKDLLEENGKVIGYLTGSSIYNQLGLTTQVSNTIQIGKINYVLILKESDITSLLYCKKIQSQKRIFLYFKYWIQSDI